MTHEEEKALLAEAAQIAEKAMPMYPFEKSDFKNGEPTEDAVKRVASAVSALLSPEQLEACAKRTLDQQIEAFMNELAAMGVLRAVRNAEGEKAFKRIRDWTKEEGSLAWARAKARTGFEDGD